MREWSLSRVPVLSRRFLSGLFCARDSEGHAIVVALGANSGKQFFPQQLSVPQALQVRS